MIAVKLKLKLGYLSSETTFCHFPNVRMQANDFREETVADHKAEEYRNTLQDYWRSSKPDLIIYRNKTISTFLVNPFNVDVVDELR